MAQDEKTPLTTLKAEPNHELKVIGVGFPRTGTRSLHTALLQLGYTPAHHMQTSILPETFPYRHSLGWLRVFHTRDPATRRRLIASLFSSGGYVASVDFPPSLFVEDLVALYPDAKFVLTTRRGGAAAWRASFDATIDTMSHTWWRACTFVLPSQRLVIGPMERAWQKQCVERYGVGVYATGSVGAYQGHNEWVRRVVPRERLLEGYEDLGWEELCGFLGREVPAGVEYPRVNDKEEVRKWFREGAVVGCVVWGMWIAGVGAVGWWIRSH